MDVDATLRISVLVAAGLASTAVLLGGFVTPVAGRWRDGARRIIIHQIGPFLHGEADRPGGQERYRGFASFGRVWLARRDSGHAHLRSLGFVESAIPVVDGAVTGRMRFRLRGRRLEGEFIGLRFDFSDPPVRILAAVAVQPTQRVWEREA